MMKMSKAHRALDDYRIKWRTWVKPQLWNSAVIYDEHSDLNEETWEKIQEALERGGSSYQERLNKFLEARS